MSIIKTIAPQILIQKDFCVPKVKFDLTFQHEMSLVNKPWQALWTSSEIDDKDIISAWYLWCKMSGMDEFIDENQIYRITPKKNLKIYEINSCSDYYSDELIKDDVHYINFKKMARAGFDGIHLTGRGAALGHRFTGESLLQLNSWDCESTVWFNTEWIDKIEEL